MRHILPDMTVLHIRHRGGPAGSKALPQWKSVARPFHHILADAACALQAAASRGGTVGAELPSSLRLPAALPAALQLQQLQATAGRGQAAGAFRDPSSSRKASSSSSHSVSCPPTTSNIR